MKKAMIITVGTGKTGEDIAGAICYSIDRERPDRILFLKTTISSGTTMPHVLASPVLEGRDVVEAVIDDPSDVQAIATICEKHIRDLIDRGFSPENLVADFTSGTKAMSAGLTLAAINAGVGNLVYISGERDRDGRVIRGTEKAVSVRPNRMTAESLLDEAMRLFNAYQYDSCVKTLDRAKSLYQGPGFVKRCAVLQALGRGYGLWDRFDLRGAFSVLKGIDEKDLPEDWNVSRTVKLNKQALYREINEDFCEERAVDLLENARRRGDAEKKYDDALARLYRLCEYIAQLQLKREGLYKVKDGKVDTSDVALEGLPAEIQEKYTRYLNERDGKVMLPLYQSFNLLADVGNKIGKAFLQDERLSRKLLQIRNNSILAHGFTPVSPKTYKDMMGCLEDLLRTSMENVDRLMSMVRFPTIGR